MRRRLRLAALVCVACAISVPTAASATVLITEPHRHIVVGDDLAVGYWYQPSGGARWMRITLYHGRHLVRRRTVRAGNRWRTWYYDPQSTGWWTLYLRTSRWHDKYRIHVGVGD